MYYFYLYFTVTQSAATPTWGNIIATNFAFTPDTNYTRVSIGNSSGSTGALSPGNGQVTMHSLSHYYYDEIRMNATSSTVQITSMNGKTYNGTLTASQKGHYPKWNKCNCKNACYQLNLFFSYNTTPSCRRSICNSFYYSIR